MPLSSLYTIVVVMFAWVLFRADTLEYAVQYWGAMFQFSLTAAQKAMFWGQIGLELKLALVIAIASISAAAGPAYAGGYEAPDTGTEALGRGATFPAKAGSPPATLYTVGVLATQPGPRPGQTPAATSGPPVSFPG